MLKNDRRVRRTRERLQDTLLEMLCEQSYDSITVKGIVDRANVGRTTFYEHYNGKEDLFLHCHETIVIGFHQIHSQPDALLSSEAPSEIISVYQNLIEKREMLLPLFQSQDGAMILRRIRDASARKVEERLRATYPYSESSIPLDMLAGYLVGAQITLMQWWLENRQPYSIDELAQTFHRLQQAAICDAFGLNHIE